MTKYTETMRSWHMPHVVSANYSRTRGSSGASSHPVHIPALMPLISFGPMQTTSKPIKASIFCNDSKCKPSVSGSITTQNYITVPVYEHNGFSLPIFRLGAAMRVEALNGDYNKLYISHHVDSSVLY